jgi:Zn-dependent peptidase ImmA (M78 family)
LIKFRCSIVDKKNNNTPILKDKEIDDLAEILLKDYKPQLLKEPTPINYLHFLESYLGATLEFHDIFYGADEQPILGATAFNDEVLRVFDKENMCVGNIHVNNRTIILDNSIMKEGKEGLALFTALHEGGHLWMHPGVYNRTIGQLSLFESLAIKPVVCCRRKNIESFGDSGGVRTAEGWREHHADYFASAIAMPKSTFIPFVKETLDSFGIRGGRIITGIDLSHNRFAKYQLPKIISDMYGVSKTAAFIKLKKFGFVLPCDVIKQQQAQISFL